MKTRDQAIDDLAQSEVYCNHLPRFGSDYCRALAAIFGDDWVNGHTLVKARHDLMTAVDKARDYPHRVALIESKKERRE